MDLGCGCHLFRGRACSEQFPKEHYRDVRNMCAELDHEALDFVMMGAMMTNTTIGNSVHRRGHVVSSNIHVYTLTFHKDL